MTEAQEEDKQPYIERFYNPIFSAYDFVSLFSAFYASQKEYSFIKDHLVDFISICKKHGKYDNLLGDIHLRSNGINSYSEALDEAVAKLKWARILYTISPEQDSTVYIFDNTPFAEMMKNKIDFLDEMTDFIGNFKGYEIENNAQFQKSISSYRS